MIEISKMIEEFNEVKQELLNAIEKKEFHEAIDMKGYMTGLTKGMTIVLDSNVYTYTQEDRTNVDHCISFINHLDND